MSAALEELRLGRIEALHFRSGSASLYVKQDCQTAKKNQHQESRAMVGLRYCCNADKAATAATATAAG